MVYFYSGERIFREKISVPSVHNGMRLLYSILAVRTLQFDVSLALMHVHINNIIFFAFTVIVMRVLNSELV